MKDVSIIIVNYNTKEFLEKAVYSIIENTLDISYEIILIDNASLDGSFDFTQKLQDKDEFKIIKLDKNVGFAKANNIAATYAEGKYILLLNPDTLLFENTIKKVLDFRVSLSKPAIIGIKLLNPDGSFQPCRSQFPKIYNFLVQAFFLNSIFKKSKYFDRVNYGWQDPEVISYVDSVKGAFLFVDTPIWKELKGFDEDYFVYTEEVDFCFRAKKKGIDVIYYPETAIIHFGGESMDLNRLETYIEMQKTILLFLKKNRGKIYSSIFRFVLALSAFNRILLNFLLQFFKKPKSYFDNKWRLYLYTFIWFISGYRKNVKIKLK
ncbi:MAG: hypothetical protein Kow0042_08030 [Calditrichia bacterium]